MDKLLKKGIKVPKLLRINLEQYTIEMEYIKGIKLKDYLNDPLRSPEEIIHIIEQIGILVLQVH